MRKLCFLLTALLLTVPSFAGVIISCAQVSDTNMVQVSYTASDDANRPRAFGMDISLDNDMLIDDIVSGTESTDYWVYPGTIDISGGSINGYGTPMAPNTAPGACGGPGESCMTVELGSLYNDPCDPAHDTPPDNNGVLFRFKVYGAGDCNVTISGNGARGNVVLEDSEQADVSYGTCYVSLECYAGQADYDEWATVGKPDSWCYPRQCHGDTDDAQGQIGKQSYWVSNEDLATFLDGYATAYSGDPSVDPWIAADFDHALGQIGKQSYRVANEDLAILLDYYANPTVDPNCMQ